MVTIKGDTIQIRTDKDIREIESKMNQVEMQYTPFVVSELTTLINQLIIDPIQNNMRKAGISSKVVDRTYLSTKAENNGETITFYVMSDYVSDTGFAVAKMIEGGRRAYTVKAPDPTPDRPYPHLKYIKDGKVHYRKKVNIPAKPASNIIRDGIAAGQPRIQKELNTRTKKWLSGILKS